MISMKLGLVKACPQITACLALLCFSQPSYAHVRWFIADGTNPDVSLPPFDTISLAIVLTTLSLFALAALFTRVPILPPTH